jgi:hypothetical protein
MSEERGWHKWQKAERRPGDNFCEWCGTFETDILVDAQHQYTICPFWKLIIAHNAKMKTPPYPVPERHPLPSPPTVAAIQATIQRNQPYWQQILSYYFPWTHDKHIKQE